MGHDAQPVGNIDTVLNTGTYCWRQSQLMMSPFTPDHPVFSVPGAVQELCQRPGQQNESWTRMEVKPTSPIQK